MKKLITTIVLIASVHANANDVRNQAVKNSIMVKAILTGLKQEQGIKCQTYLDESGEESITYYTENNLSKFNAAFLCSDGRTSIITGVIGDGGQTQTESFSLVYAN